MEAGRQRSPLSSARAAKNRIGRSLCTCSHPTEAGLEAAPAKSQGLCQCVSEETRSNYALPYLVQEMFIFEQEGACTKKPAVSQQALLCVSQADVIREEGW